MLFIPSDMYTAPPKLLATGIMHKEYPCFSTKLNVHNTAAPPGPPPHVKLTKYTVAPL